MFTLFGDVCFHWKQNFDWTFSFTLFTSQKSQKNVSWNLLVIRYCCQLRLFQQVKNKHLNSCQLEEKKVRLKIKLFFFETKHTLQCYTYFYIWFWFWWKRSLLLKKTWLLNFWRQVQYNKQGFVTLN